MDTNEARAFASKISRMRAALIPEEMVMVAAEQIAYELRPYTLKEVDDTLEDVYLPYYPHELKKFISDIKSVAEYNRLPEEVKRKDREEALERWHKAISKEEPVKEVNLDDLPF